jgi:formate hydrogenlyase subunit 3/multisubunit Na+/H+ antiporter MnhD subunit
MSNIMLPLIPGLPLLLAAMATLPATRRLAFFLLPAAALPALLAALTLDYAVELQQPWLLLGSTLGLDPVSRTFLLFTAVLWTAAGAYAIPYLRSDAERTSFAVAFLLAMAGNFGLLVARDIFTFYAFFALMSFSAYGLIVHGRSDKAYFAGRVTIVMVVAGELALFAGFALAVAGTGATLLAELRTQALSGLALWLLTVGFGIKLGMMPLHLWLPLAHAAAPVPASAVLSGAMIKAGLFGLLSVLPLGLTALPGPGGTLVVCGLASVIFATLIGVTQRDPKAVLAYSSVGQMGLIGVALGVGLLAPAAWPILAPVVALYAAHHAFAKAALFLGFGAFAASPAPAWRIGAAAGLALPAAALTAIPWTAGYEAKAGLKAALEFAPYGLADWLPTAVALSSAATILLVVRFALLTRRLQVAHRPSRLVALPWTALVACSALATSLLWGDAHAVEESYDLATGLWPPLLGLLLAALAIILAQTVGLRLGEVPAGEFLALIERGSTVGRPPKGQVVRTALARLRHRHVAWTARVERIIATLATRERQWQTSGALLVLVLALLLLAEAAAHFYATLEQLTKAA